MIKFMSKLFADVSAWLGGIDYKWYVASCRFINRCQDELGLSRVYFGQLESGGKGLLYELCGRGQYQLRWERNRLTLAMLRKGRFHAVWEGVPNLESEWARLFGAIRQCEEGAKVDGEKLSSELLRSLQQRRLR
jgi:hypothetical protein